MKAAREAGAGAAADTEARDQAQLDAEARDAEIAALRKRLEQFSEAAKADLAEAHAKHERLRNEIDASAASHAALQAELADLRQRHATQLQNVIAERDALDQQKRHFAEQVAALKKFETPQKESLRMESERSQRETQRHAGELQRRIIALEGSQREVAQELTREREARIRAERVAAQADRAREDATALVEAMRDDARRELEAGTRKRDAEIARVQKDLQDKLNAQAEAWTRLKAERDALAKERDELSAALHEQGVVSAGRDQVLEALTQQRDAARKRVERLQAELDELLAHPPADPALVAELDRTKAALKRHTT